MFSSLEAIVFQKGTDVQGSKDQVTKVREYICEDIQEMLQKKTFPKDQKKEIWGTNNDKTNASFE